MSTLAIWELDNINWHGGQTMVTSTGTRARFFFKGIAFYVILWYNVCRSNTLTV